MSNCTRTAANEAAKLCCLPCIHNCSEYKQGEKKQTSYVADMSLLWTWNWEKSAQRERIFKVNSQVHCWQIFSSPKKAFLVSYIWLLTFLFENERNASCMDFGLGGWNLDGKPRWLFHRESYHSKSIKLQVLRHIEFHQFGFIGMRG